MLSSDLLRIHSAPIFQTNTCFQHFGVIWNLEACDNCAEHGEVCWAGACNCWQEAFCQTFCALRDHGRADDHFIQTKKFEFILSLLNFGILIFYSKRQMVNLFHCITLGTSTLLLIAKILVTLIDFFFFWTLCKWTRFFTLFMPLYSPIRNHCTQFQQNTFKLLESETFMNAIT